MLEVIESDFARLETDTEAAEDAAVASFRKFKADSEEDRAVKATEVEHKESKKQVTEQALESSKRSLDQTREQLDAAIAYYEKLKPTCVDVGVSFEERVARRNEELVSLKEAYKILSGEDVPSFRDMKSEQIGVEGYDF